MKRLLMSLLLLASVFSFANDSNGQQRKRHGFLKFNNQRLLTKLDSVYEFPTSTNFFHENMKVRQMFQISKIHYLKRGLPFGKRCKKKFYCRVEFEILEDFDGRYLLFVKKSKDEKAYYLGAIKSEDGETYNLQLELKLYGRSARGGGRTNLGFGFSLPGIGGTTAKYVAVALNLAFKPSNEGSIEIVKNDYEFISGYTGWLKYFSRIKEKDSLDPKSFKIKTRDYLYNPSKDKFPDVKSRFSNFEVSEDFFKLNGDIVRVADYDVDTQSMTLEDPFGNIIFDNIHRSELNSLRYLDSGVFEVHTIGKATKPLTADTLEGEWKCVATGGRHLGETGFRLRNNSTSLIKKHSKVLRHDRLARTHILKTGNGPRNRFSVPSNQAAIGSDGKGNFYRLSSGFAHFVDYASEYLPISYFPAGEQGNLKNLDMLKIPSVKIKEGSGEVEKGQTFYCFGEPR